MQKAWSNLLLSIPVAVSLATAQEPAPPPRSLQQPGPAPPRSPARRQSSREPIITTFAGTDWIFQGDGGPAVSAPLSQVDQLALDLEGNIVVADPGNHMVARLNPDGTLTVLAGNGIAGFSGDSGPARDASLNSPRAAVMDADGNLFIADQVNNCIRRVTRDGIISTYAGSPKGGFTGDGGPATRAALNRPSGLALDRTGNLYIVDSVNNRIRKVSRDGTISTFAGNGQAGFSGDGGPATQGSLRPQRGIAVDADGNLYISDFGNGRIRRVTADGRIATFAGNGLSGGAGDNGPATAASLTNPDGLAFDQSGNLYVADLSNFRIRRIARDGIITTVAGGEAPGFSGDGGSALEARISFARGVAVDASGRLFIADTGNSRVRRVDRAGNIATVAGNGGFRSAPDGTPASSAFFSDPEGLAFDSAGNLLVSDAGNVRLRQIDRTGTFRTIAGSGLVGCCRAGPALEDLIGYPTGIVADKQGNIFFSDTLSYRVRRLSADGTISTYAGTGVPGFGGDGGPATAALLAGPYGLALDRLGNLYIADTPNQRIRRVSPDGVISTIAGNGARGFSGDSGPATEASLRSPNAMAFDSPGNLLIADIDNHRIRSVSPGGIITTLAGTGVAASTGDGGPAAEATLNGPAAMAIDPGGNVFVAELFGGVVRRIAADRTIFTVAGNGARGFSGDGGPATLASLNQPVDIALDAAGNLFIADSGNNRIRVVPVNSPGFDPASPPLVFSGRAGGAPPPAQRITLGASVTGVSFSATATADRGDWLQVSPRAGETPRLLEVTVDPANLAPGTYRGRIAVLMVDATPIVRAIPVEFTVDPAEPARLELDKPNLSFPLPLGAGALSQTFTVSNAGSGILPFGAMASTDSGGGWLVVSQTSASVSPANPAVLTVTANPAGLPPGTYSGNVTVTGGGESKTTSVKLLVSALDRAILLSQTGLTFTTVAGGGAPPPQSFAVLNTGRGIINWTASASTLSGGRGWLIPSATRGATDAASGSVPSLEVRVSSAGLPPGGYYGQVRIDAPGAANTPQFVTVFLEVLPPGSDPGPAVEPSELIFHGVAGEPAPGSKEIHLYNLTGDEVTYRSTAVTENGGNWLVHLPRDATLRREGPTRLVAQPVTGDLPPGIYRGNLALKFSDGSLRNVSLVFIVSAPGVNSPSAARADGPCSAASLLPVLSSLGQSFSVSAGWPVALVAEVRDDCGEPVDSGEVVASFTNGDPPQRFTSLKNGIWHGTWRTGSAALSDVTIKIQAVDRRNIRGVREIRGGLRSIQELPVVNSGSVVSAASFAPFVPLAPGGLISISGERLAEGQAESSAVPLPVELGGTAVLIAGRLLPLVSVSENRIEAIVPFDVEINTTHQILVQRGSTISQPIAVDMAAAQPAIFPGRISAISPAKRGDRIVILCAGLGAVEGNVNAGDAGPDAPRASVRQSMRLTIGGVEASVSFAGLAPGLAGIYQIEAIVPQSAPSGDATPVVLQIAGQTSPIVNMAIE